MPPRQATGYRGQVREIDQREALAKVAAAPKPEDPALDGRARQEGVEIHAPPGLESTSRWARHLRISQLLELDALMISESVFAEATSSALCSK